GLLLNLWLAKAGGEIDRRFLEWAGNTVMLAALAAALAATLALPLAYGVRLSRSRSLGLAVRLAGLGYAMPGTVIAIGTLIALAAFDNGVDALSRELFGISTGLLLT